MSVVGYTEDAAKRAFAQKLRDLADRIERGEWRNVRIEGRADSVDRYDRSERFRGKDYIGETWWIDLRK